MFASLSIKVKIILLAVLVTALPAFVISFMSVSSASGALEHMLAEELQNEAKIVGERIDAFYEQRIVDMAVLSQADVLESSDSSSINAYFSEVLAANKSFSSFWVLNQNKQVYAGAGSALRLGESLGAVHTNLGSLYSLTLKAKQGEVYMSDALAHKGSVSVFVMTPVTDDSNTIVEAVLLAEVPISPVKAIMAEWDESIIGDKSVYLLNDDSQVIVTGDADQALFELFNDLKVDPSIAEATEVDGSQAYRIYTDFHGDEVMAGMADMRSHGTNEALDWGIIAVAEMEAIAAPVVSLRNGIVAVTLVSVLLSAALAFVVVTFIVRPIVAMNKEMKELAAGGGDLTKRIELEAKDEVGELAGSFNAFIRNLNTLISDFKASASDLSGSVSTMLDVSARTKDECARQQSETDMVAAAITELSAAAQEVAGSAQEAADAARNADSLSIQGGEVVRDAIQSINDLATELQSARSVVEDVEGHVGSISSMVDVIRGIAEQTNLLALNAAIEAARAGDQGRGFAVVADEVRALASKTQDSTEEINRLIELLKTASKQAVGSMQHSMTMGEQSVEKSDNAGNFLNNITEAVSTISKMNIQIAAAAEQQTAVSEDLTRNVNSISEATISVTAAADESEQTSRHVSEISNTIERNVDNFKV